MAAMAKVAAETEGLATAGEAVLDVGGVDEDKDEKAAGVGQDMPLAALDLLARVIPARAAAFGGFRAVSVHSGSYPHELK